MPCRRPLACTIVLFLLSARPDNVMAADVLKEHLSGLDENAWVKITAEPSKRWVLQTRDENSAAVEETTREPAFREYTSPAFGDGKIFYFGGGHGGYFGNDVEIYDPAANRWHQTYRPVCPPKDDSTYYSGGSERSYVDPETGAAQPYVIHGYARTGYDSARHQYVCTAMFPTKVERDAATQKWKLSTQAFSYIAFDEKTNRWELLATMPDELKPGSTSLTFDPGLGCMLAFNERAAYAFQEGAWKLLGSSEAPLAASGGAPAVYLPDRKTHWVAALGHGGANESGSLSLFNTAEKQGHRGPALPDELQGRINPGTGGFNLIMAYDEAHKTVVFMSVNSDLRPDVWTYQVTANQWKYLPLAATTPKLMGVFEPGRGRAPLLYDPARHLFWLLYRNEQSAELWAYRPPASAGK